MFFTVFYIVFDMFMSASHLSQLSSALRASYNVKFYLIINDLFGMFNIKFKSSQTRITIYFNPTIVATGMSKGMAQKFNTPISKPSALSPSPSPPSPRAFIAQLHADSRLKLTCSATPHTCRRCSQAFSSENQLHIHLRSAHNALNRRCRKAQSI